MSDDIEALVPTKGRVTVAGREVEVGPLTVDQILAVLKVFKGGKLERIAASANLLDMIEELPDEMIEVAMIGGGLTREEVGQITGEELVLLVAEIIDRNQDFFARRLGPSLKKLAAVLVKIMALTVAGSMPLQS